MNGDLLRFYTPDGFKKVNKKQFKYSKKAGMKQLKADQKKQTSLASQAKDQPLPEYQTDAPELKPETASSITNESGSSSSGSAGADSTSSTAGQQAEPPADSSESK